MLDFHHLHKLPLLDPDGPRAKATTNYQHILHCDHYDRWHKSNVVVPLVVMKDGLTTCTFLFSKIPWQRHVPVLCLLARYMPGDTAQAL
jgi:hypothetical protein